MENEFVTYPLALRMKALGFDERCLAMYKNNIGVGVSLITTIEDKEDIPSASIFYIKAPTWQSAFRWFREQKGLWVQFAYDNDDPDIEGMYWYITAAFQYGIGPLFFHDLASFKTYEEAQEACLIKLCEIVEKQLKSE